MNTLKEKETELHALSSQELMATNGGFLQYVAMWCGYLLQHEEQLVDGLTDAWNEFTETIKN